MSIIDEFVRYGTSFMPGIVGTTAPPPTLIKIRPA
jgi:hypothetical protein